MSFTKTLLKSSIGAASLAVGAAELLFFLMSNRKGNVDFIFDDTESEKDRLIRENREKDLEWLLSQPLEDFNITSKDGLNLHASLLRAEVESDKYVLAIHGYRCYGHKEFDSISRFYHEQGINVFMIDHRASGESEGKYITYGAKERLDCLAWLSFMRKTFGEDIKIILHGCSMGSATTMLLCGSMLPNNVIFAVADCGYSSLKEQLYHNFKQNHFPPAICYTLYRQASIIQGDFDPDLVNPAEAMKKCNIPVIFAHGEDDDFVPFEMVYKVYDACQNPNKSLITVPGAAHVQAFQLSEQFRDTISNYIKELM